MTTNHVGDRFTRPGMGFGLGYEVVDDVGESGISGSLGTHGWRGAVWRTKPSQMQGVRGHDELDRKVGLQRLTD